MLSQKQAAKRHASAACFAQLKAGPCSTNAAQPCWTRCMVMRGAGAHASSGSQLGGSSVVMPRRRRHGLSYASGPVVAHASRASIVA